MTEHHPPEGDEDIEREYEDRARVEVGQLAGDLVRQARRFADLSQRELARRAVVPHSTVGRIESGEAGAPRWGTVVGLLHAAGCRLLLEPIRSAAGRPAGGSAEEPRDRADRRYPAHLDVRAGQHLRPRPVATGRAPPR